MSIVTDCLQRLPHRPWSFVLHLGAGQTDLTEAYAPLRPTRLVLVEGDPDSARALTGALTALPGAEVIEQAVSPTGSDLRWQRYNLRSLNGPLPAQDLAAYYPRLRSLPSIELPSLPVAALIDRLLPPEDADPDSATTTRTAAQPGRLLVLDVPGQELALLEALGIERLHRFDQVVVHGRSLDNGVGNTFAAAWDWMRAAHVEMEPRPADAPRRLWDAAWGHIDHRALEVETLRSQMDRLQALLLHGSSRETELSSRLDTTANALTLTARQRDEQILWLEENAQWAKGLDAELKKLRPAHEQLQAQLDQQTARAKAAETEIEQLKAELAAARNRADTDRQEREALEVQLARVAKERDTEAHWHRENAKWAQGLKAELDPLKPELERLRRELDIAHREAAETRTRADVQRREIDERDARQRLMDTEIVRVEAQLDLIKQVLIREKNF